jgi:hypothetical protein
MEAMLMMSDEGWRQLPGSKAELAYRIRVSWLGRQNCDFLDCRYKVLGKTSKFYEDTNLLDLRVELCLYIQSAPTCGLRKMKAEVCEHSLCLPSSQRPSLT